MKKIMLLATISVLLMLGSLLFVPVNAAPPPIKRPYQIYEATIEGGNPETCDPAWAYDTASGELIENVYDKLVYFDGENLNYFIPRLALCYTIENITGATSPEGLPLYFRYTFRIRGTTGAVTLAPGGPYPYSGSGSPMGKTFTITSCPGWPDVVGRIATVDHWTDNGNGVLDPCDYIIVKFYYPCDWWDCFVLHVEGVAGGSYECMEQPVPFQCGYYLTPADVEYTFERAMVQDRAGGPTWMFYEPLLNAEQATDLGNIGNCTNPGPDVNLVGEEIDYAVQSNTTHVWFNFAFPGAYAPFLQILTQSWSAIMSKQWVNSYVIGTLHRNDWSGDWQYLGNYTEWICHHNPDVSPLDDPTPIMCGCGQFSLVTLDYTDKYWAIHKFDEYWGGWPCEWPAPPYPSDPTKNIKTAGWVTDVQDTWAFTWPVRSAMFLAGDCDFVAVPRQYIGDVVGQDDVRCIYPLPVLAVDNLFFTFDIDPTTPYGTIFDYGVLGETGIPRDFFGNASWGIHTRMAFSYCFDYATYISTTFLGEAITPATAIIPGLLCFDPTVPGYTFDLNKAVTEFKKVPGLWDTGFTITIMYNTDNIPRMNAANMLHDNIGLLNNTKFHVNVASVDWKPYLRAMVRSQLSCFIIGWLVDYPDPHDFAFPFYHSSGTFAAWQKYSNPTMDALIEAGIRAPPAARCAIYSAVQSLARADTPSIPIDQAVGRHFERDWVCGWYFNTCYPGNYFCNLWKWYYCPHSKYDVSPPYVVSNRLPSDVNYDGKVDMKDIGWVCKAYGSYYGPPQHPRWNFRCDVSNDRKVDMKDVGWVCKDYGCTSATWVPP